MKSKTVLLLLAGATATAVGILAKKDPEFVKDLVHFFITGTYTEH